jgi:glycosyltransferase involved in cell wall biosynthesis
MTLPYFLARVYRFVKENNFDLIHAHATLYCFIPALLVGRIVGVPVICEVRSIWGNEAASKSFLITLQYFLIKQVEWLCLKRSNLTIFLNERLSNHIDPMGKLNSSISPNGISFPSSMSFRPIHHYPLKLKTEVLFGYVGGLNLYENVEILIEAVSVLHERGLSVRLLIYGHGPMLKELERVSVGKEFVSIMGKFKPEDRGSIYDSLDVVVYPRSSIELTETVTPLKPLEAALFRVKIVASSIGGHTDLLKSDGISWFKPDDLDSLVTVLETVIELSPSTLTKDVASVFHFVTDNHDWNKLGFILLEKYRRLAADF